MCRLPDRRKKGEWEREKGAKEKKEGSACHKCLCFCISFTHLIFLFNLIASTVNMRPITNRDVPQHGPNLIILFIPYPLSPTPSLFPFLLIPYLFRSLLRRLLMRTFVLYTVSGVARCGCYIREWHDRRGSTDKTLLRAWTWWTLTWREEKGNCSLSLDTNMSKYGQCSQPLS